MFPKVRSVGTPRLHTIIDSIVRSYSIIFEWFVIRLRCWLAEIWSPAGGFFADPKHWRRNTAVAIVYVIYAIMSVYVFILYKKCEQYQLALAENTRGGRKSCVCTDTWYQVQQQRNGIACWFLWHMNIRNILMHLKIFHNVIIRAEDWRWLAALSFQKVCPWNKDTRFLIVAFHHSDGPPNLFRLLLLLHEIRKTVSTLDIYNY